MFDTGGGHLHQVTGCHQDDPELVTELIPRPVDLAELLEAHLIPGEDILHPGRTEPDWIQGCAVQYSAVQ